MDKKQLIIENQLIAYHISGKGPLVVCLHGWGDEMITFANFEKKMNKKFTLLFIDLPGFGGSSAPRTSWSLNEYAHSVASIIRKLNLDSVYAYIGHSNGGAILMYGIGKGILNSKKLVLIGSSGIRGKNKLRKNSIKALTKIGGLVISPLPSKYKSSFKKKLYASIGSDALLKPELIETFRKITAQDVLPQAGKIESPTLLVWGENDKATPVEYGYLFNAAIRHSKLSIIKNAGHFVHLDQPEETLFQIEEFLRKNVD